MVTKIIVGVLASALLTGGGAVAYRQATGMCPIQALMQGTGCCHSDSKTEECKQTPAEPASCCQQPTTQITSELGCCSDIPNSLVKDGRETLLIEPREVK